MELLPLELLEHILLRCEDEALAISVPRICKLSRDITCPNGRIWREKCKMKGQVEKPLKKQQVTWKKIYFSISIHLFPLSGHVIGQATFHQLRNSPGAEIHHHYPDDGLRYVTIDEHNFHVDEYTYLGIFTKMHIVKGTTPIPKAWEEFGITWSRSWLDYKELLRRWNGNFIVNAAPHYSGGAKNYFIAEIASVARHSDEVYYMIYFCFYYPEGKEDSMDTLHQISITSQRLNHHLNFESIYDAQMIVDQPSLIQPDPSQVQAANQTPSTSYKDLKYILIVALAVAIVYLMPEFS